MILEKLDRLSDWIFRRVSKASASCGGRDLMEGERVEVKSPSRIYRWVLRWQEHGLVFRWKRFLFHGFLNSRVSDVGVLLVLWGAVELAWYGFALHTFHFVSLGRILAASVLLHEPQSCGRCIQRSRMLRGFLFSFCGLSEAAFASHRKTRTPSVIWLLMGGIMGILGCLTSPIAVTVGVSASLPLILAFSVPELAFLTALLFFPFFNLLSHPTWWLFCTVLLCGLACLGKTISGKRQLEWGHTDRLVLLLGFLYAMSGIVSFGRLSDGLLRCFLLLTGWFLTRLLLASPQWRQRAVECLTLSSTISAILGILQYVLGKAPLGWVDTARFGDIGGRVCGTFGNPNLFAIFLLFTGTLPLAGSFEGKSAAERWRSFFSFVLGGVCLLLTWSRGAWLGWLAAVLLFLSVCSRRSLSVLMVGSALAVGAIPFLPNTVLRRFQSIGNFADTSANYRLNTWRGVGRMIRAHPWGIGCGEEAFRRVFPTYAVSGTERVMHPHQVFLEAITELGVVGFFVFLLILWRLAVCFFDFCKSARQGRRRAEGISLFCALLGGIIMGLFDSLWYHNGLFWLFWIVCAMCENSKRRENA